MSEWGEGLQHTALPYEHRRALDILYNFFGGRMHTMDLFVASVEHRAMRDLVDQGIVRKKLFGYEITLKGIKLLRNE